MRGNSFTSIFLSLLVLSSSVLSLRRQSREEEDLETATRNFLELVNNGLAEIYNEDMTANYNYEIHGRDEDIKRASEATMLFMKYIVEVNIDTRPLLNSMINDYDLKRQLQKLPKVGYIALSEDERKVIEEASANMSMIYQTVKLCSFKDPSSCNLTLIPGIQDTLHGSDDIAEVEYYWLEWKRKTGTGLKESFQKFIDLYRKTAQLNGFTKPSDMWFKNFEENNVVGMLERIMTKIHPLFEQFHAYVRSVLRQKYGSDLVPVNFPYPQHISEIFLGDAYLYEDTGIFMFPYPEVGVPNITEKLIEQGYTAEKLFEISTDFFASIGLPKIPESFLTTNAMKADHPEKKVLGCWNRAWNFHHPEPIKMSYCPDVNYQRYQDMHEVVSNIIYYQQWTNLPTVYQSEPLPNFSDVIGKTFSLSASTPKHLEKLGILPEGTYDEQTRINRLYLDGMQQLFLLPVLYVLDKYRVQILDGEIPSWDNCAYWALNEKYIGAMPPIDRRPGDFDAPSKLLIGVDDEYSSIIVAIIAQFQIYKHFCEITGEYVPGDPNSPLDNCDLSDHPELGDIVQNAMSIGSSRPWRDVLEALTGTKELDASGFLEYFDPLLKWLEQQNLQNGAEIGWTASNQCAQEIGNLRDLQILNLGEINLLDVQRKIRERNVVRELHIILPLEVANMD